MVGLDSSFSTSNLGEATPWANHSSVILGVVITFLVLSWICVLGRLYTRLKVVREPGWDDLCVVIFSLFTTIDSIAIGLSLNYGLGQHFILLRVDQMVNYLKAFYVMSAGYCTATVFIKEALLLQYLRVYEPGTLIYRITLGVAVFTALWGASYTIISWVPCMPVTSFWLSPADKKCWGYGSSNSTEFVATFESHAAFNMVIDFIVLLIPLPLMYREGTSIKQKLRVMALVVMGTLVIVLAIWRLQTIIEHKVATWPTHDPTWYAPITVILGVVEVNLAAICASVPIFWPVIEAGWGSIFVTQEVKITRETRYFDEEQLSHHSRHDSVTELRRADSNKSQVAFELSQHYQDEFVMRSINPLHSPAEGRPRAEAVITTKIEKELPPKPWHI